MGSSREFSILTTAVLAAFVRRRKIPLIWGSNTAADRTVKSKSERAWRYLS
jgi:hypothetical protein